MADIVIDSVSASFTGTDNADTFRNATGNLRDITVQGLSGDDILSFGSAVQAGTGDGGVGLGYSIGSASIQMGAGQDSLTFSGQAGSGASRFNSTQIKLGLDDDFVVVNGLVSASGSVVKGNEGADEMTFNNESGGGTTANDVVVAGNAGQDVINVSWTGTEAAGFRVKGGADDDVISGTFLAVSAYSEAAAGQSGLVFRGNKGNDIINLGVQGTSTEVNVKGNSGADTIVVTAAADITNLTIGGGKDADVISAVFAAPNSANAVAVQGNDGDDIVAATFSGSFITGFTLGGGDGNDALSFNTQGVAVTAGSANSILGGTGADTITLNLGSNVSVTGASGFVADLGVAGVSAVSGGSAGVKGGVIDINLSATLSTQSGAGIFFRGSNSDDLISISNANVSAGAFGISNATFSAESGADTITLASFSAGNYSALSFNAGAGNDVITAQIGFGGNFSTTAGAIAFNGEAGDDSFVVNIASGSTLTAASFVGGSGADSFVANLLSGGALATQASGGTQLLGGSGADTFGIIGSTGAQAATILQGGDGADLITGSFASAGNANNLTAVAGEGADTIAFTFSAAVTAGVAMAGGAGGTFDGGSGADSISVIGQNTLTGGTFNFGTIRGGDGVDTITFGGQLGASGGLAGAFTGSVNAGAGADSIVFSGNNVVSGLVGTFAGQGTNGSGGFRIASGDSVIGGFDTIFVSNNDVTGGQANLAGTFGSAGFVFSSYNDVNAGTFTMAVATATVGNATYTAGRSLFNAGQSIFVAADLDTAGLAGIAVLTGGVIGAVSAGTLGAAGADVSTGGVAVNGAYVLTGGSTLGQIFSSVDSVVNVRGKAAVFNVQNGSAGEIDGFLFVEGGTLTDTIVKFDTNTLGGAIARNAGYFSAGVSMALDTTRTVDTNSGGDIFFGGNVGVG
jgi:hypothetical protein